MILNPDSGYMAWVWADDPEVRTALKRTLDELSDGIVQARGLYLFHPDKYDELVSLRKEYSNREDAGVVVLIYDTAV
jgi:hypothetical protein